MYKPFPLYLAAFLLASCSSSGPIVDTAGADMSRYEQDLSECELYGQDVKAGEDVAKGAAAGAATGAAIEIIRDGNIVQGAGVGAVLGVLSGGTRAKREQQTVVKNCLRGRGYKVLN